MNKDPTKVGAAVIFDMDGVLVDSEPLHLESTNILLGAEGASLSADENKVYLGWNERAYWTALVDRFGLRGEVDAYILRRHDVLVELLKDRLPVMPGVVDFVRELGLRGVRIAVASSSDRALIDFVLDGAGLGEAFAAIASGDEVARSKPDPEIFELAARRLGVDASSCVVFEDSANGVAAARAAGMACLRVVTETTRTLDIPGADGIIEGFVDLDVGGFLAWLTARTERTGS